MNDWQPYVDGAGATVITLEMLELFRSRLQAKAERPRFNSLVVSQAEFDRWYGPQS